jgi:hypothetical protein
MKDKEIKFDANKTIQERLEEHYHEHSQYSAEDLIELGESEADLGEDWSIYSEDPVEYGEDPGDLQLASTGRAIPNARSEQDTDDILIRYIYSGSKVPQRDFCKLMMSADKIYRKEDIVRMQRNPVNAGFGPNGARVYDIWLWKGGVYCYHQWLRRIYIKNGNDEIDTLSTIGTAAAIRAGYKVETNDTLVSIKPINTPTRGVYPG